MNDKSQVHPLQPTAPYPPAGYGGYPNNGLGGGQGDMGYPGYPPPAYPQGNHQDSRYGGQPPPMPPMPPMMPGLMPQGASDPRERDRINNDLDTGNSFSDKKIRHAFIRKVYLILMVQLLCTVGIIAIFIFVKPVKNWVRTHGWFYYISYAVFFVTYMVLICVPSVRRKVPGNYICLAIFTLAMSYMAGALSSYHSTEIVFIAIAITAAVCLAISLFAIQTKIDFTMCSGLMFALSMVLVFFGFACLIVFLIKRDSFASYVLYVVYSAIAALVFSLFLVFHTQMIVGGKNRRNQLSPEEYITGALQLYMDVVNLFFAILGLAGAANR